MAEPTQLDRIEAMLNEQAREISRIKERLTAGEEEFRNLKWDIWLGNSAVKQLCILAGAKEHVMALTSRQAERFNGATTMTGLPYRDEPTDPGPDGEEPPATNGTPQ